MKKIITTLLCLALGTTTLWAQNHVLTLDSCISMALRHQATLKNARLDVKQARQTRKEAFTRYFPTLSASASYFTSLNPLIDLHSSEAEGSVTVHTELDDNADFPFDVDQALHDLVNSLDIDVGIQMLDHGTMMGLSAMQPIFVGGRIINGNKLAQLGIDAAELQLAMSINEVVLSTTQRYQMVLSLMEKQKVVEQALQLIDTLQRDAQSAFDAGIVGRNDLLKVRLKRTELLSQQQQLNNGLHLATLALRQFIGLSMTDTSTWVLTPVKLNEKETLPLLLSDAEECVCKRAESQLLDLQVEAKQIERKMQLGEMLPQLMMGGTYGYSNILGNKYSQNGIVFASLNVPLTAWWSGSHTLKKKNIELQKAENLRNELHEQMILQTLQAHSTMVEASLQLKMKQEAVSQAQENLEENRHYYQAGLSSISDYLEAQTLFQQCLDDQAEQEQNLILAILRYNQLCSNN